MSTWLNDFNKAVTTNPTVTTLDGKTIISFAITKALQNSLWVLSSMYGDLESVKYCSDDDADSDTLCRVDMHWLDYKKTRLSTPILTVQARPFWGWISAQARERGSESLARKDMMSALNARNARRILAKDMTTSKLVAQMPSEMRDRARSQLRCLVFPINLEDHMPPNVRSWLDDYRSSSSKP